MTKNVITVFPETKVTEVAALMARYNFSGMPVARDGKLAGIITEYDLMSHESDFHIPTYIKFLKNFLAEGASKDPFESESMKKILNLTAVDIMTKNVTTAAPDMEIHDLLVMLVDKKVNSVPVVDSSGAILGIVSRSDIMKLLGDNRQIVA